MRLHSPVRFADLVVAKRADLAISASHPRGEPGEAPVGGGISEANLRRLDVHAAIRLPEVLDEVLPEYVPRDVDAAESGIRARVKVAAERGGFVLVVGGPQWGRPAARQRRSGQCCPTGGWYIRPGPAEVAALAQAPFSRMVVWLDELQRYLDGEDGLADGVMRALLGAPTLR